MTGWDGDWQRLREEQAAARETDKTWLGGGPGAGETYSSSSFSSPASSPVHVRTPEEEAAFQKRLAEMQEQRRKEKEEQDKREEPILVGAIFALAIAIVAWWLDANGILDPILQKAYDWGLKLAPTLDWLGDFLYEKLNPFYTWLENL